MVFRKGFLVKKQKPGTCSNPRPIQTTGMVANNFDFSQPPNVKMSGIKRKGAKTSRINTKPETNSAKAKNKQKQHTHTQTDIQSAKANKTKTLNNQPEANFLPSSPIRSFTSKGSSKRLCQWGAPLRNPALRSSSSAWPTGPISKTWTWKTFFSKKHNNNAWLAESKGNPQKTNQKGELILWKKNGVT